MRENLTGITSTYKIGNSNKMDLHQVVDAINNVVDASATATPNVVDPHCDFFK
jgi:hypothetical protein